MASYLDGILNRGRLAVAEKMATFAEARNRVLADNIANIDTPFYKARDLPVAEFQRMLGRAIEQSAAGSPLRLESTENIEVTGDGRMNFKPVEVKGGRLLFHDQNNRDLEQEMAELVKNNMMHKTAIEVMRKQFETLEMAIRERL